MADSKIKDSLCENCGQPLFLNKDECKDFIEDKLKQGFIVCGCCGSNEKVKHHKKYE